MATNQMKNLMTEQPNGISILCAPDCDGSFVLYEDDGVSMDYEKGCYFKNFHFHGCWGAHRSHL